MFDAKSLIFQILEFYMLKSLIYDFGCDWFGFKLLSKREDGRRMEKRFSHTFTFVTQTHTKHTDIHSLTYKLFYTANTSLE